MAAFVTRTQDSSLRRGSKRAALQQFWTTTPRYDASLGGLGTTAVGGNATQLAASDGEDVWVASAASGTVARVRGSDGKLLETWTGANNAFGVLAAMGRGFVIGAISLTNLYMINPSQPAGAVTVVASTAGSGGGIAFDGSRIWTANGSPGSVSIITPTAFPPWSVLNLPGFMSPVGILFDGSNIWVTEKDGGTLKKLDQNGTVVGTVTVGSGPQLPAFDGTNIWVPNSGSSTLSVVRASTGTVVATLSGNGLSSPFQAAFDGQRILVTNLGNQSVSLWKAADLTPIGNFSTGSTGSPLGACSDGTNFWITLFGSNRLARF